jgi:hypothetical protein
MTQATSSDVELAMTALAIGRAIHAAGRITHMEPVIRRRLRVAGCIGCPFGMLYDGGEDADRIRCRVTGVLADAPPLSRYLGTCPLRGHGAVLVTMEDR